MLMWCGVVGVLINWSMLIHMGNNSIIFIDLEHFIRIYQ